MSATALTVPATAEARLAALRVELLARRAGNDVLIGRSQLIHAASLENVLLDRLLPLTEPVEATS